MNHDKALTRNVQEQKTAGVSPTSLSSAEFFHRYMIPNERPFELNDKSLILDDTPYHFIDTNDIPPGYAEVDVLLVDSGVKFNCMLTAGHVGNMVSDSRDFDWKIHGSGVRDMVRPLVGWWMYEKPSPEEK